LSKFEGIRTLDGMKQALKDLIEFCRQHREYGTTLQAIEVFYSGEIWSLEKGEFYTMSDNEKDALAKKIDEYLSDSKQRKPHARWGSP